MLKVRKSVQKSVRENAFAVAGRAVASPQRNLFKKGSRAGVPPKGIGLSVLAGLKQESHSLKADSADSGGSSNVSPADCQGGVAAISQVQLSCFGASVAEELVGPSKETNAIDLQNGLLCSSIVHIRSRESESQGRRRWVVQQKIEQALTKHAYPTLQNSALNHAGLAAQLESALHDALGNEEKKYTKQARSILFNLNDPQNTDFRSMLAIGFIRPKEVPHLSAEQMASYERTVRRDRMRKAGREEIDKDWDAKHALAYAEGVLACDRCWGTQTTHFQLQTRRCDEAATTYVMCMTCHERWKC